MDHFSKFAFGQPVRRATSAIAARFLHNIFNQVGAFKQTLSDAGTQFTGQKFLDAAQKYGISHHNTGAAHFEGNGSLERLVRTLGAMQSKVCEQPEDWVQHIQQTIHGYNSTPHSTTGEVPGAVFFQQPWKSVSDCHHQVSPPQPTSLQQVQKVAQLSRERMAKQHKSSAWRRIRVC